MNLTVRFLVYLIGVSVIFTWLVDSLRSIWVMPLPQVVSNSFDTFRHKYCRALLKFFILPHRA